MIVVAELKKPCTDKARADFIVENNHNKGYEIRETETELQAWGYTEEEKQEITAREELATEEAAQNYTEAVTLSAKSWTPVIQFKAIEGQYIASGATKYRIYQNGELVAENNQFVISVAGIVSVEAYSSTAGDFIINVRRI